MRWQHLAAVALLTTLGCAGGAGSQRGAVVRKAFLIQQVTPEPQWRAPNMALDPEEAGVIARSYVRSLAGKSPAETPESVLFVAPQSRGRAAPLAPSVPKD